MDAPIFITAYVSDATQPFSRSQLLELLARSRARNEAEGLTGMLLHDGGNFLQALEGPETAVRDAVARIERDPRHHHLEVMLFDHIPERLFAEWTMGFAEARGLSEIDHPGLSTFMQRKAPENSTSHGALQLLSTFRGVASH